MFYIYRIINTINNHDYIGKKRIKEGKDPLQDGYLGSGTLINKAIEKYGKENFRKEILDNNITSDLEASKTEIERIKEYKGKGLAYYNISPGGEGLPRRTDVFSISEEYVKTYRERVADKVREDWENTSLEKRLLRNSHMSEGWRNKKDLEDWCDKRSQTQKEVMRKLSDEERNTLSKKISQSLKEGYQKRTKVRKGTRVYKIQKPNGEIIYVKGLANWCRNNFKRPQSASSCLTGDAHRYKGYSLLEDVTFSEENPFKEPALINS